jgi:hypothetical protein
MLSHTVRPVQRISGENPSIPVISVQVDISTRPEFVGKSLIGNDTQSNEFRRPSPRAASRVTARFRATETAKPATQRFLLLSPCETSLRRRSTLTSAIPFVAQHLAVGAKNQSFLCNPKHRRVTLNCAAFPVQTNLMTTRRRSQEVVFGLNALVTALAKRASSRCWARLASSGDTRRTPHPQDPLGWHS